MSSSEDGGASDFDLGPFEKRNARRELIFREETGQFREDYTKLGRQSSNARFMEEISLPSSSQPASVFGEKPRKGLQTRLGPAQESLDRQG